MPNLFSSLSGTMGIAMNFLKTSPFGPIIIILAVLLAVLFFVIPLIRKLRLKRIKNKETRNIMKDLLTWRHLAQLVKGGEEHDRAKQDLSDNIVRINELLKQGFGHAARNVPNLYALPWYVVLGEPRSGKSSLLAASDLELVPSVEEKNPEEDPNNSLPVRIWTGAKAVLYDISGKIFFDRWLDASSAEWNYIVRQICRRGRRKALDGVILTIPADALLIDDENLSSRKAILMANELGNLLRQSGMRLPCYVVVTKLDMVSGFQEYSGAFTGDLRHQILGFESDNRVFVEETFGKFWAKLYDRLRSGSKQLIFPASGLSGSTGENRMDRTGKIWLFPDNFSGLYGNLKTYLEILFGEENFHGTGNTFFEGVFFTSSKDMDFSFSPEIASLAGRNVEDVFIPVSRASSANDTASKALELNTPSTALVVVNASRTLLAPYLQRANLLQGYFIRDLLHKRIFVPSPHADFVRSEAMRRHIPQYFLCAALAALGSVFLFSALFERDKLRSSLIMHESYYSWLDPVLQKNAPSRSPLIKEDEYRRFTLDRAPLYGESLSSRLQFYYNTLTQRDLGTPVPFGFGLSKVLVFGFNRNMGYRQKAFIANQLQKSMVRIPVIKNIGSKLIEEVDTQILDHDTRGVIVSFVSLDEVQGVDFYKFFTARDFKLDSMIRYLVPDISNDTMELLSNYKPGYDRSNAPQMDIDYIYSPDYAAAKQAALDTMLSAWKRGAVYPDSIYGKIKNLAAISEEITVNYRDIENALKKINGVSSLSDVEEAVYEWKSLTDRHKALTARGRAIFEEVRSLLKAAHIPLPFEANLPTLNMSGKGAIVQKKVSLDAFNNNLINDYLFNDMVISYAVQEYLRLFDADMEFIKLKTGNTDGGLRGQVIAEQNSFSGNLEKEVEALRLNARILQDNALLSDRLDEKPDAPSLFMTVEKIITLASDIPVPNRNTLQKSGFNVNWQTGQSTIKTATDAFESFVKPHGENEKVSALIANARVMMLAEAYYNRYITFTTSYAFLNSFEGNIAAVIEAEADGSGLFSFSGSTIENLFGGFYYNKGYDPVQLKFIVDNVASFAALFKTGEDAKNQPPFLRNVDKRMYQPRAFMDYLSNYIMYWGNYPDRIYVSAGTWDRFMSRASQYKSFQINSVLLSVYAKSLEFLNQIDNTLLNDTLVALRNRYAASLGDKLALMNQFLSADAERMFSAWASLPRDPLEAYAILRSVSEEDLKNSYLTVYTGAQDAGNAAIGIGWWNSFVIDGSQILARHTDETNRTRLLENYEKYRAYPLCSNALPANALDFKTMQEIASLFEAMGAALPQGQDAPPDQTGRDPVHAALHHSLFSGSDIQNWAGTVYQIASAAAGVEKPFSWIIHQPPVEVQNRLPVRSRLMAMDRFRYVEVSSAGNNPRSSSTYMNEKLILLQGNVDNGGISFKFYKTSRDREPGALIAYNNPWSIFELYLTEDYAMDDKGNNYIPIYLEDEAGKYIYYVELEFNVEIPASSVWYSSRTWPEITITDGMIVEKR
ncbi:hypothetical protein LQZ19_01915 [Treponema primitia]|uniref:type VI secretion protein IcmF/TssM N-terminal domain-containing protein n=1 Tax=Treponema primitia TaxID=88058 RepID=UPI00398062FA